MYEYIKGTVAEVAPAYAVIDVGGVGYYLHISLETYSAIEHETETRLYVHYVVREDAQLLYGFSTKAERELFRLLISVSGVGGNTARMILSTYSPRELQGIITAGNAVLLKNVKGLGLKTAQAQQESIQKKVASYQSNAQKEAQTLDEENYVFTNRAQDLLHRAVQEINSGKKYKLILNASALIDADTTLNITPAVLAKVNELYAADKKAEKK